MEKKPKGKVVLFLIEGLSELEALRNAVGELYDQIDAKIQVEFQIYQGERGKTGGDVTSAFYDKKNKVKPQNIEKAICKGFMMPYYNKTKIVPTEIIHVVDTDGAFVPDGIVKMVTNIEKEQFCAKYKKVLEQEKVYLEKRKFYTEESIFCADVDKVEDIKKRNAQKSRNLIYLSKMKTIKIEMIKNEVNEIEIPYSVYYFSCNLDHFLYNKANLNSADKFRKAREFSKKHGSLDKFVEFISDDSDAVHSMDYKESWEYIRQDNNSLQRHTNFNLLLEKLLKEIQK